MANKEQVKILQSEKKQEKAALDKKTQTVAKPQKRVAPTTQPKKRRFTFIRDIVAELRKVAWPTRQETIRLTLIVLGVCIAMGALLGAIDYGFSELMAKVFLGGK